MQNNLGRVAGLPGLLGLPGLPGLPFHTPLNLCSSMQRLRYMFLDFSDSINKTWAEKSHIIIVHDRIMSFMFNVSLEEEVNCKYSSSF